MQKFATFIPSRAFAKNNTILKGSPRSKKLVLITVRKEEFNAESINIKTELQLMQLRVRVRRSDVTRFHSGRIFMRDESRESCCCIIRNYIR